MMILGKSRGVAAVIAVAVGLVAGVPATAAAQQPAPAPTTGAAPAPAAKPADPRALFASGEKKFKAGDYAGALADFEASNAAKEDPATLRYIGQTQDNLGHAQEAVGAYEKFLANVPASMRAQGEDAKRRVDAIKATPGHVHVESMPTGATVTVDGQTPGPSPTPTDLELPPGHHTLTLNAQGYDVATKEVDVGYAAKQDLRVDLTKTPEPPPPPPVVEAPVQPPPPPPPPPPEEPRSKIPAYVTGAVAIVAAGVGTGFGLKALGQSNDFEKTPTTKLADDGENNALVADMMFGVAITFGVTSAVLFLSSDASPNHAKKEPAKTEKRKITITPAPIVTRSGGGAGALVSF